MTEVSDELPVQVDDPSGFYNGEDGIYQGIPWADYHAVERASNTVLSTLLDKSPAHAKAKMEDEYKETRAQKFGNAVHAAVLEPDLFGAEWGQKEQCSGTTNSGSRCGRSGKHAVVVEETGEILWYCGTHYKDDYIDEDIRPLSESQMERVQAIQERARSHPTVSELLYGYPHAAELTVLWTNEQTGVQCKSRIDMVIRHPEFGVIPLDLKTTTDASPEDRGFRRSAARYGYYRQSAFYRTALLESGVPAEDYYMFVAAEKKPPYALVPYLLMDDEEQAPLSEGAKEMLEALKVWKKCQVGGRWPGYTDEVEVLDLPEWAYGTNYTYDE